MGIGIKEILIIAAIALLIFGSRRLRAIGSDMGGFIGGIKRGFSSEKESAEPTNTVAKETK